MKRALALFFLLATTAFVSAAPQNILLIIADDYGVDSSSLYNSTNNGASLPPTPNIVSLAQSGVLFRNAYANPVCSPTRATIMTGRHGFRTGIGDVVAMGTPALTVTEFTLPEAFAANSVLGYTLAHFGKWHLANGINSPNTIGGWPHFTGSLQGAISSYTNWTKTVNGVSTANYTNYATTDLVNDAVTWIQARGTNAWFAWVAFNTPHTPLHKPPNDLHSYDALSGTQMNINANPRPYYEAMVEAMDTEIGRLLGAVNRTNTHIIFMGDNGTPNNLLQPPFPSGRGKNSLYEGGIHVPFIIAGPSVVNPGRTNDTPINTVDLFSTILEIAKIDIAATVPTNITIDSQSLLPLLQSDAIMSRHAYSESFNEIAPANSDGRTLRNGQFKLIKFRDGREEFYDLVSDPYETANLKNGTMTVTQEANYFSLTLRLAGYQQALAQPVIVSAGKTNNTFTLALQRDTNLVYSLWRSLEGENLTWFPVTNAVTTTNGLNRILLADPAAIESRQLYRVVGMSP